ncbi:hypothetical protein AVEN_215958-1 [Araneus ventricosus]|uniref:Uncharacterized protein n=1 Tax=Araneus ventricosus TaxID=182803 RepID=A0A4Y2L3Z0_ARAVE|nr:hypothetical protein AVEN_215958-1 [Araneus ventricosus]
MEYIWKADVLVLWVPKNLVGAWSHSLSNTTDGIHMESDRPRLVGTKESCWSHSVSYTTDGIHMESERSSSCGSQRILLELELSTFETYSALCGDHLRNSQV